MQKLRRKVSTQTFVRTAELLENAFPRAAATPDYLLHECEKAEQALLNEIGKGGVTGDSDLAQRFGLSLRPKARRSR